MLLVVTVGVMGGGDGSHDPLDPRSNDPDGASAAVSLLEGLGAQVTRGDDDDVPGPGDDVALVLEDRMDESQREALDRWVSAGGRAVVADPGSPLAPRARGGVDHDVLDAGACPLRALREVARVEPGSGAVTLDATAGEGCFAEGGGVWLTARTRGSGTLVVAGSPGPWTNAGLGRADNAVLVAALGAPRGDERVLVVRASAGLGAGDRSLVDLVPDGVRRGVVQALVAFALYAAWRAVRLGRPVPETDAVLVAGSELVEATGRLLERAGDPAGAAALLRREARRGAARRMGLPVTSSVGAPVPDALLVAEVARRSGIDPATVALALAHEPVSDDAGLLALARAVAELGEAGVMGTGRQRDLP